MTEQEKTNRGMMNREEFEKASSKKELLERWSNFYIIRNDKDIVTHCPPYLFGYAHVGNIIHIGRYHRYGIIKSHFQENIRKSLLEDIDLLSFDEK